VRHIVTTHREKLVLPSESMYCIACEYHTRKTQRHIRDRLTSVNYPFGILVGVPYLRIAVPHTGTNSQNCITFFSICSKTVKCAMSWTYCFRQVDIVLSAYRLSNMTRVRVMVFCSWSVCVVFPDICSRIPSTYGPRQFPSLVRVQPAVIRRFEYFRKRML